ncbi:MAG: hypothetical protein K2G78_03640, partial [Muribaculaceae bacterium]|nr:hypothetical protein [Muribaculaceae bacterium]
IGHGRIVTRTPEARVALLSIGEIGNEAAEAVRILAEKGIKASHYDMIWLKPLDTDLLEQVAAGHDLILTIEDGALKGGFGSAVGEWLEARQAAHPEAKAPRHISAGIPDQWIAQGSVAQLRAIAGIDANSISQLVTANIEPAI